MPAFSPPSPAADSRPAVVVAAGILWLLLLLPFAASVGDRALDDFFITYRYAHNLAAGDGFVYNPGTAPDGRVFGTTAPGQGLLLAAVSALGGLTVPWAGTVVTAASLWGVAVLLLVEGRRRGRTAEALLAGTMLVASRYLWVHTGAEAFPVTALLVAAAFVAGKRPATAGLLAGLAIWFRPDCGLAVGLLGLMLWVEGRRFPWRFAVAGGAVLAAGLAAAQLWFGSPLPATLVAKRTHTVFMPGTWHGGWGIWRPALAQLRQTYLGAAAVPFVVLGGLGHVALLARGGRAVRLLALQSIALSVAYPLLGVPFFSWYALPMVVALVYGTAELAGTVGRAVADWIGSRAERWQAPRPRFAVAAVVAGLLLLPVLPAAAAAGWRQVATPWDAVRYPVYRPTAEWIRRHTPPGARLATVEVGVLGYYADRPVVDLMGLVTPSSLPQLAHGSLAGAFLAGKPDLLAVFEPMRGFHGSIVHAPWFRRSFREVARFRHPRNGSLLRLYQRLPWASLPPPVAPAAEPADEEGTANGETAKRPSP